MSAVRLVQSRRRALRLDLIRTNTGICNAKLLVLALSYLLCATAQAANSDDSGWTRTLERIANSVVSIQIRPDSCLRHRNQQLGQATGSSSMPSAA